MDPTAAPRRPRAARRLLCGAAVALAGMLYAAPAAAAEPLEIVIGFLGREEEPVYPLALNEPVVETPALPGAKLGVEDNATTGRFLNQAFTLSPHIAAPDADIVAVFTEMTESGIRLFVSDLPREDLLAVAGAPAARDVLIFNGRVTDDDLRRETCFPALFHTAPSRAMLADGLIQYLVWKKWVRLHLMGGERPADQAFAAALKRSATKFGAKIVGETPYAYSPIARRTDSGHMQVQRQMPIATQDAGDDYQVLLVADESEVFGEYVPYQTWAPRPVAGTHGLVATTWHRVQEQWGSTQFQRRFEEAAGRWMEPRDYGAWLGVRAIGEAAARTGSADPGELRAYLRGPDFALGGFKGVGLSFRPWNQQMRQPVLLTTKRVLVSASPQPGFLHQRSELDSLGFDEPEVDCALE